MSNTNDMLNDPEILRELIMDHYQYPHIHKLTGEADYKSVHMASDSCIDDITVQSKIKDGKIEDIRFDGEACAISTSATSIMIRSLIGKSVGEAEKILSNYRNMINEKEYDRDLLGELTVYDEVCKQPNRKGCALIPYKAIEKILEGLNNENQ